MKKKLIIVSIIVLAVLLVIVGIFFYERAHVSFHNDEDGTSISIIGGADGPTAIFLAGKIGGDSEVDEEVVVEEIKNMQVEIQIGDKFMLAELEDNASTEELVELLEGEELVMSASNYGGFEKVCKIGQSIARDDEQITTEPGDIMLYSGNQIVIFYDSNSWAYTPIGHIDASADELEEFLSGDETEVIIRLAE